MTVAKEFNSTMLHMNYNMKYDAVPKNTLWG